MKAALLALAVAAAPVPPGASHSQRVLRMLQETQDLAGRLSLETGWAQTWLRALEATPTDATRTLTEARLVKLGDDLLTRIVRLERALVRHREAWSNPRLQTRIDRTRHLQTVDRLLRSCRRIAEIPRSYLVLLRKRRKEKR